MSHPNVWCSHFEFSGDQRELYKHLFLPGKDMPTAKARTATLPEKVCTKCSKNCTTLPELHRHMLECGGDQAWLLGLFGNGKKKCKWRPFGSRSRRRRQRGMKRNIQNSQTPRVNTPKEKQPTGPRVRPSDSEWFFLAYCIFWGKIYIYIYIYSKTNCFIKIFFIFFLPSIEKLIVYFQWAILLILLYGKIQGETKIDSKFYFNF